MRIISDFHDYYDSAQSYGQDPNLLYVRKTQHFESAHWSAPTDPKALGMPQEQFDIVKQVFRHIETLPRTLYTVERRHAEKLEAPITVKIIGFCGYLYAAIVVDEHTYFDTGKIVPGVSDPFLRRYGLRRDELDEALRFKSKHHIWGYGWSRHKPITHENWGAATNEFQGKRVDALFVSLGIPAFKVEFETDNVQRLESKMYRCTLNPQLKLEEFQKVKPPAQAFQEISMYLGNQLARQPDPISTVSDEIMRDQKGFDEWSFRRHKEEDKKLRKKRERGF